VGEHGVDVDTQVAWPVSGQLPLCLLELRADAAWVAPLGVYERAGVEDQALVEVAPPLAPWALEHFVALPVLSRIEQLKKAVERLRKVLEVRAAALGHRPCLDAPTSRSMAYRPSRAVFRRAMASDMADSRIRLRSTSESGLVGAS
jgi:hypothetical protein